MPFASNTELPDRVRGAVPSSEGQSLFRRVVNERLDEGVSESRAFASAWTALQRAGFERNDEGEWVKKAQPGVDAVNVGGAPSKPRRRRKPKDDAVTEKRHINDDVFTTPMEARARANDLGLDGEIHQHETADGQVVWMPGTSHEAYVSAVAEANGQPAPDAESAGLLGALRELKDLLVGKREVKPMAKTDPEPEAVSIEGSVLKTDEDQRIVWGWASVITEKGEPVVDSQGDVIQPDTLVKATSEFMLDVRVAKAMHEGDQIGEVIHSLPLTDEIGKSLGIEADREGWIVALKIHDDDVWKRIKAGELSAFSIGGQALREPVNAD